MEWYASKSNCICTRFCITDDLEKSNEMITSASSSFDHKNAAAISVQPPNAHLFLGADNASNQAKKNYHFAWMVDYIEEASDHPAQFYS